MNLGTFDFELGPIRGTDYPVYSDALLDWYQRKGMTSVRLLFTWEAVQSSLGGALPATGDHFDDYWNDLVSALVRLLARNAYVILCPWQYNSNSADTDIVYRGASFSSADFADFWSKFAVAMNAATGTDQRVAFDLINEPHTLTESGSKAGDIGIALVDWFDRARAAIDAIRNSGATNTIFVPGMAYAAAKTFASNGSSDAWVAATVGFENVAVTVHCYIGLGSSEATVLRDDCNALVSWARGAGVKVNVGEIAIDAGPNGLPTFASTFEIATTQWADWAAFCSENSDVLVGWNWWANSAKNWWNKGDSADPAGFHWGLTLDDGLTQTVYMDVIETAIDL